MPKKAGINLVSNKNSSFAQRFIDWALTAGRIVVIFTELIALSAFLYRFTLDQQLIDLHSKIKQEQAIVAYLKDSEKSYRNLQDRLTIASDFSQTNDVRIKTFEDIIALAPSGLSFEEFNLSNNKIRINSLVYSVSSLSKFVDSLKKYKEVDKVVIDKIQNKATSGVLMVTINVDLKSKAYASKAR